MRLREIAAVLSAAAAAAVSVSSCDVSQINWSNKSYAVSSACAGAPVTVQLHNGVGVNGRTRVQVFGVYRGDFTGDRIADAAVVLGCTDAQGGNQSGSEVQVFTRDAKPLARLVAPGGGNDFVVVGGPQKPFINTLTHKFSTWVATFGPGAPLCCPSSIDLYSRDWNGHGFTPAYQLVD